MAIYSINRTQYIKAELPEVWAFFSNPGNLANITPDYMNFKVTSEPFSGEIYPGQIITYKVSPLLGIPLSWMTEITSVERLYRFVDEQRMGPYKIWHHQHLFEKTELGVKMTDIVHYQLPYLWVGDIAHSMFIKKKINSIFDHRCSVISKLFI
ncbi:MAG: SRPBCC family protein [Chitinophagaceae bacterium]|nr:SRPBCC family protein [Chitinophagaceae bacterium]